MGSPEPLARLTRSKPHQAAINQSGGAVDDRALILRILQHREERACVGILRDEAIVRKREEEVAAKERAEAEKKAIDSANPNDSTLPKSPYVGVQFAAIPEFQAIGVSVGQHMSAALAGKTTVDAALKAGQIAADREMRKAGYYK